MTFKKKINRAKTFNPQTDDNKVLKEKVLDSVGDAFSELYYIYKDKHNKEKDGLNARDTTEDNNTKTKKILKFMFH